MTVKKKASNTAVYAKNVIIDAASTFGVTKELMAGALYDVTEPITQEQATSKLKAYMAKPIK